MQVQIDDRGITVTQLVEEVLRGRNGEERLRQVTVTSHFGWTSFGAPYHRWHKCLDIVSRMISSKKVNHPFAFAMEVNNSVK
jgi:hypothetical protein